MTTHRPDLDQPSAHHPGRMTRRTLLALSGQGAALSLLALFPSREASAKETLDAKIAQMVFTGFHGSTLGTSNPIVKDIRDRRIGGVFLSDFGTSTNSAALSNIKSPTQVKALIAALQQLAGGSLLIGVDQEGGSVARLKERYGFPATVTQQYLGRLNNLRTTRRYADATAGTLANAGFNLNLAPVVDLNTNPSNPVIGKLGRSFSADPTVVINHSLQVLEAHRSRGLGCSLKHFPGHGSSRADSHLGFVDVTRTWSEGELQPYERIIKAGKCDLVMTAHIFNSKLDPELPATLSRKTITGILRDKLGFAGVIMSDDMQMKAISMHYSLERALYLAIDAGVDIFTLTPSRAYQGDLALRVIRAIKSHVQSGAISPARIDQSYQRIRHFKAGLQGPGARG